MCPRCRSIATEPLVPPLGGDLARCPTCGLALVASETLAESDGDPFLGTTIAGRFVVTGRLGAGSMGTVYRARQEAMGRDVAVKILRSDRAFDAQAKARFTREARATSQLMSPHTVTVFDFGEIPDADEASDGSGASLYLAMELLEGESLGQRLKRLKRLPFDQAVTIARHALLSLAEAHEKGVIHRDLKPDNLFLTKGIPAHDDGYARGGGEICKVLDFGIAKVVSDQAAAVDALETQAGTVFGTPRYMSPEQAQGKPLDARSDLY
ncbi:MAG TPA: serine/threonine-protein kinase, partial [Byssovorax sp.]